VVYVMIAELLNILEELERKRAKYKNGKNK
jgi:hypothetical protein